MAEKRCINCMQIIPEEVSKCPHCGFEEEYYQTEVYQLPIGYMLQDNRYQIGRVIGEGGFGVTYIGWDHKFNQVVAIKEFYMKGVVSRFNTVSYSLTLNKKSHEEQYEKSLLKVEQEAKILKQFAFCPGIVRVEDFFRTNNTVYIVMEYVEGMSLRDYCKKNGGSMDGSACMEMFCSLIESLYQVHKRKIIHRDISPDNIMIQKDGILKLLDFGSARSTDYSTKSVTVKYGYAPLEQYHSDTNNQGAWIDVYALCASIYYCLTGRQLQDSQLRRQEEDIWTDTGVPKIKKCQKETLEKGLRLDYRDRIQSMDDLYFGLYGTHLDKTTETVRDEDHRRKTKDRKGWGISKKRILGASAGVMLFAVAAGLVCNMFLWNEDTHETSEAQGNNEEDTMTSWNRMDEEEPEEKAETVETHMETWTDAEGNIYTGPEEVNGVPNGSGICRYKNGDFFEGVWSEGKPHGEGTFTKADGTSYAGNWTMGVAGPGTIYYTGGSVYEGTCAGEFPDTPYPMGTNATWFFAGDDEGQREKFVGDISVLSAFVSGTLYYSDGTAETGSWEILAQEGSTLEENISGQWKKIE